MKDKNSNLVIQDWVTSLHYKSQTGLISAIRGSDIFPENKTIKSVVKNIRYLVLKNADKVTGFMSDRIREVEETAKIITEFRNSIRVLSKELAKVSDLVIVNEHPVDHLIMAFKIIRDKHPDSYVRMYYKEVMVILDKEGNNE